MGTNAGLSKESDINNSDLELTWIKRYEDEVLLSSFDRFKMKLKRNPLVPLGVLATATALGVGLRSYLRGDSVKSQKMMRFRVGFQGVTIIAMVAGIYWEAYLKKSKED